MCLMSEQDTVKKLSALMQLCKLLLPLCVTLERRRERKSAGAEKTESKKKFK